MATFFSDPSLSGLQSLLKGVLASPQHPVKSCRRHVPSLAGVKLQPAFSSPSMWDSWEVILSRVPLSQ